MDGQSQLPGPDTEDNLACLDDFDVDISLQAHLIFIWAAEGRESSFSHQILLYWLANPAGPNFFLLVLSFLDGALVWLGLPKM